MISVLPVGNPNKEDTLGWHFTKAGNYTVKYGYHTARLEINEDTAFIGRDITTLKAYVWKVQCPPKLRYFLWQILSGCVPVSENLQNRGILCDKGCVRCGATEETINHTLFQARFGLSLKFHRPRDFPTNSIFTNLDHLFWRIPPGIDSDSLPMDNLVYLESKK